MENPLGKQPYKVLYSLSESAESLKCSVADLVRAGAGGDLSLCVRVPRDISVFAVDRAFLPGGRWHGNVDVQTAVRLVWYVGPQHKETLGALILDEKQCREIEALGETNVQQFQSGWYIDTNYCCSKASPHDGLHGELNLTRQAMSRELGREILEFEPPWVHSRLFITYASGAVNKRPTASSMGLPVSIKIGPKDVVVVAEELRRFEQTRRVARIETYQTAYHHDSQKLADLHRAAEYFWSEAARAREGYPPKNRTVTDYLLKLNGEWSESLAKTAASIIRPPYANDPRAQLSPGTKTYISDELSALDEVARQFWIGVARDDRSEHPEDKDVVDVLMREYKFSGVRAEAGAAIIRPVQNKGGRRPAKKRSTAQGLVP